MRIGPADTDDRAAIVGEIGNNHEGDVKVALELVRAAADAGADAVKLQAIDPAQLVRPSESRRIAQLEQFRLTRNEFEKVAALAHDLGLGFSCTPFSIDAVEWLTPLVDAFKIASGDNDVPLLLDAVARSGKPVVFSTGMSSRQTVSAAHERLRARGARQIGILHCVSCYPTAREDACLASIPDLAEHFSDSVVGYSDHTLGIDAALAAIGLGARIVEKHMTLRHDYSDFRDHQLSADPGELRELVSRARSAEPPAPGDPLLGHPKHDVLPAEEAVAQAARRSLVASHDLAAGHLLTTGDLVALRPRDGLAPSDEPALLGRRLARDLSRGDTVTARAVAR